MENDNSRLARACDQWGYLDDGKWGWGRDADRLYFLPAGFYYLYYWMLRPDDKDLRCDDDYRSGVSNGDFWKVFVR